MVIAGLVLNIIGTGLLVFFALPQPQHNDSPGIALEDNTPIEGGTVREVKERALRMKVMYRRLAFLGLMFPTASASFCSCGAQ